MAKLSIALKHAFQLGVDELSYSVYPYPDGEEVSIFYHKDGSFSASGVHDPEVSVAFGRYLHGKYTTEEIMNVGNSILVSIEDDAELEVVCMWGRAPGHESLTIVKIVSDYTLMHDPGVFDLYLPADMYCAQQFGCFEACLPLKEKNFGLIADRIMAVTNSIFDDAFDSVVTSAHRTIWYPHVSNVCYGIQVCLCYFIVESTSLNRDNTPAYTPAQRFVSANSFVDELPIDIICGTHGLAYMHSQSLPMVEDNYSHFIRYVTNYASNVSRCFIAGSCGVAIDETMISSIINKRIIEWLKRYTP